MNFRAIFKPGQSDNLTTSENRSIYVTNISAVVGSSFFAYYLFVFNITDSRSFIPASLILAFFIPVVLFTVYFNLRKWHLFASFWINLMLSLPVFVISRLYFGNAIGTHTFFIMLVILPVLTIFRYRLWATLFLSLLNLGFYLLTFRAIPIYTVLQHLNVSTIQYLDTASRVMAIFTIIVACINYQRLLQDGEAALEKLALDLRNAYNEMN